MGLLSGLLTSPGKGLGFVFSQIRNSVDHELYDETIWQQKLLDVQLRHDMGEISEEEYFSQEEAIVAQLEFISLRRFTRDEDEEEEYEDEEVFLADTDGEIEAESDIEVLNVPSYATAN